MSADTSDLTFRTAIVGIEGTWPEPPSYWSFSTLTEAEACALRWSMSRATFAAVWPNPGYPSLPAPAALAGEVVHLAVEQIVAAFVSAGCVSVGDERAVDVLRALGGYRELLKRCTNHVLESLSANPRATGRIAYFQRSLDQRSSDMRRQVQSLISRVDISASVVKERVGADLQEDVTRHGSSDLPDGVFPEFWVTSERLRFRGKLDLITITDGNVEITDFKTGPTDDHHLEQLRSYELLWLHRDRYRSRDMPVSGLTLAYPDHEVSVSVLPASDINVMTESFEHRLSAATASVGARPPAATPSEGACRYCQVRHLCDSYWAWLINQPHQDGLVDVAIQVTARNGSRSWSYRSSIEAGLLRAEEGAVFEAGRLYRLLSVRRSLPDDDTPAILSLTSATETFELRGDDSNSRVARRG
mgnify:CR=1 FL=1